MNRSYDKFIEEMPYQKRDLARSVVTADEDVAAAIAWRSRVVAKANAEGVTVRELAFLLNISRGAAHNIIVAGKGMIQ